MAKTWDGVPVLKVPTAHTLLAKVAVTLLRALVLPGFGLAICFQARPFQCSIRVLVVGPARYAPTAQALLAEVADTPARLGSGPGLGFDACFHVRPFQRAMMVFWLAPVV
jgi:hypothetical protein